MLGLSQDRPLFRRNNIILFPEEQRKGGYLINPHQGLSGSGCKTSYMDVLCFHAGCTGGQNFPLNNSNKQCWILVKCVHKVAYQYTLSGIVFQPCTSNFTWVMPPLFYLKIQFRRGWE